MRQAIEALEHQGRYRDMVWQASYVTVAQRWLEIRNTASETDAAKFHASTIGMSMDSMKIASRWGQPFWWSAQMCGLIEATYPDLPMFTLTKENIPSPNGFFWFAKPIKGLGDQTIRCVMWSMMLPPEGDKELTKKLIASNAPDHELMKHARAIQIVMFPGNDTAMKADIARLGFPTYEIPHITMSWEFGHTQEALLEEFPVTRKDGEPEYASLYCEVQALAACFALLGQRILTSQRAEYTTRADQKRLDRVSPHHDNGIRVVALRKAFSRVSGADRQSGDPIDWSCRWLVNGHWRKQWYPSLGIHQPLYILPYWKGPEDAPIKAPDQLVMSVHR